MAALNDLLQSVKLIAAWPQRIELRGEAAVVLNEQDRVTLHLVLSGSARIRSTDGAFECALQRGQYLFVPAGRNHVVGSGARQPHRLVFSDQTDRTPAIVLGQGAGFCSLLSATVEIDQTRLDAVAKIMPEIKRQVPQGAPTTFSLPDMLSVEGILQTTLIAGGNALFQCAAEAMFVNAVLHLITSGTVALLESTHSPTAPIAAAMRLIYRNPEKHWSVQDLANACNASRSAFAKSFVQQLETTPMAFLTRVRMMRAETLLRENRHSLGQIALQCGYTSETGFNRAFSNHSGMSPGAWRRTMRRNVRN